MPEETPNAATVPTGEPAAPAEPAAAAPEAPAGAPGITDPIDDDEYNDVLFEALQQVYKEMDGSAQVETPDGAAPVAKKDVDAMDADELRAALKKTNATLKTVVEVTLADREEQHAVTMWNEFLKEATPIEVEIAKAMPFEVDDKVGMKRQIELVKSQAKRAQELIEQEVATRVQDSQSELRRKFGIMSPDSGPGQQSISEEDAKDMKEGNRAAVISRRFAKIRGL